MKLKSLVSIPYRHAKNFDNWGKGLVFSNVSIPYRHAKNGYGDNSTSIWIYLFQFLIGTLKTQQIIKAIDKQLSFQFLIGTLKTVGMLIEVTRYEKFQFLIGTLKTHNAHLCKHLLYFVSIPYRHAKNKKDLGLNGKVLYSFNSL